MSALRPIDPVITFRNSQGEGGRGTLSNLQRRQLVMEIYTPSSSVQISEVLNDLTVRSRDRAIYRGKAVVVSLVNTGLMSVVSVNLMEEWSEFNAMLGDLPSIGEEAARFVDDWDRRFQIRHDYQVVVGEMRAFLSEASRWIDQADLSNALPRNLDGRLRDDVFQEMAVPINRKGKEYLIRLEEQAALVASDQSITHRNFAQTALHPLLLRAPFVYRTFTKPLGYAGDYEMVNQILGNPRCGESTYVQMINSLFLQSAVAVAHRNRIDILVRQLTEVANRAKNEGRPLRVLNVGCGPAAEVERLILSQSEVDMLAFRMVDFSDETLHYTRGRMTAALARTGKSMELELVHESVHQLLKRASAQTPQATEVPFDFVYCAGLFDYLSDKVCARLLQYFEQQADVGAEILVTNVHSSNPERHGMEHLLEWHLIYRNEQQMAKLCPPRSHCISIDTDQTGVNVFARFKVGAKSL